MSEQTVINSPFTMARPRSKHRRDAILAAATELVAEQGLGATTAEIAKTAGVPHGSVFTYFPSKIELLNALYLEVTTELTDTVLAAMPRGKDTHAQFRHLWDTWTHWGVANRSKRRAQTQLNVSELVTEENRNSAYAHADPVYQLLRRVSATGVLHHAPIRYVGALVGAWAATTMEYMTRIPTQADRLCRSGFDAVWLALSKR